MRYLLRMLVVGLCASFVATAACAKVYDHTVTELIELSDLVISGEVVSVGANTATIRVEETLKGRKAPRSITVSPIHAWHCMGHYVNFEAGEEAVVFLKSDRDRLTVVAGGAGKHRLVPERKLAALQAIRRLIEIASLEGEDTMNKAMLAEATSPNSLLRSESHRYITRRIARSDLRQSYKDDLVRLLDHKDADVRRAALFGLQFIRAEDAIPLIAEATRSDDTSEVSAASMALAQYDTAESVAALIALTRHADPNTRMRACIDLDQSRRPEAKEALKVLLTDKEPRVRAMAPRGLVYWLRRHEADEVIPTLVGMLDDPEDEVQVRAAQMLGESRDLQAVAPLLDVLRREQLTEELDNRAVEALSILYGEPDPKFREMIDADLDLTIKALERGRWVASLNAVGILSRAKTPEAVAALTSAAKNHPLADIRAYAERSLRDTEQ